MKAYRVKLGWKDVHVNEAIAGGFIGVDYAMDVDLTGAFGDNWQAFNRTWIPVYLEKNPGKTKIAAGLACGTIWKVGEEMSDGDLILTPAGSGNFRIGRIAGPYEYVPGPVLPHRRPVAWSQTVVARADLTPNLQRSALGQGTVASLDGYLAEIEQLIGGVPVAEVTVNDPTVEDPVQFALEKHLEDFLVDNWNRTELGKAFEIYTDDDGTPIGQQYPTDTGPLDILAIGKDKKELLVVELKRGKASDNVVGQVQRYMGYIKDELAEPGQTVRGVIVALDDDLRLRRALSVAQGIEFYRYTVSFELSKA